MSDVHIDWDEVRREAVEILAQYLRIDTTNPPGAEEPAARFLADILEREGIAAELVDSAPGRTSVIARLAGSGGAGKPLVLLSHSDVVPAERARWREDPFAGKIVDGVLWGRGTLDMKGMGVLELMTLLLLKRHRVPLRRDILFLAVADEEEAGLFGMEWLAANRPELLDAAFVLNEGAYGLCEFMSQPTTLFGVAPSEKGPVWLRLRTRGTPGHGSVPHLDAAPARLTRALDRALGWETEFRVLPEVRMFLERAAAAGLIPVIEDEEIIRAMAGMNPILRAMTRDTISLTTLTAGYKVNVVPSEAEATLDCRLLPGRTVEGFVKDLEARIADPDVTIEKIYGCDPIPTPLESELYDVITRVVKERGPGHDVIPQVCPGFTDCRQYRERGVTSYGFVPFLLTADELSGIHGHNERVSVANVGLGCEVLFEVVRRICA
jgi:acetylornithine deacetylase/succinyl-diaminopimelate desuccinylase-like protein